MIPQADYQMFLLTRLAEQSLKAVGPAGCLELELAPVEINELAVSFAVKSYYFHIVLCFFHRLFRAEKLVKNYTSRSCPFGLIAIVGSLRSL